MVKPDSRHAFHLLSLGYCVLPLQKYLKGPTLKGWQNITPERALALCTETQDATGWTLMPRPGDPVPLLVLDIDDYSRDPLVSWELLTGTKDTQGYGLVSTASGGLHCYFRASKEVGERVGATFDLGDGIKGDIRCSWSKGAALVLLPGSYANTRDKGLGRYDLLAWPAKGPDALQEPPEALLEKLLNPRSKTSQEQREIAQRLPTEIRFLMEALDRINAESQPRHSWNTWSAQMGEIMGRIWARRTPTEESVQQMTEILASKMLPDHLGPPNKDEIRAAIFSGYKKGHTNADTYGPRDKYPTADDIEAEMKQVFGANLWICERQNADSSRIGWTLGLGGSPKRPHEASRVIDTDTLTQDELLPNLARLTKADLNTVLRSPFNIQDGWRRGLRFYLWATRGIDREGLPTEKAFPMLLEQVAEDTALTGPFQRSMGAVPKDYAGRCWWVVTQGKAPVLVAPKDYLDELARGVSYACLRRLTKEFKPKEMRNRRLEIYRIPLTWFSEEVRLKFEAGHSRWLERQQPPKEGTPE